MRKKTGLFILILSIVIVGIASIPVKADEPAKNGTWGDISWNLSDDGTLLITGRGEIKSWDSGMSVDAPSWTDYTMGDQELKVTSIVFDEGITRIGANTFVLCSDVVSIDFPSTLEEIDEGAFAYCESLSSVVIPKSVKKIGANAFVEAHSLKTIYIDKAGVDIDATAFEEECDYEQKNHTYEYRPYDEAVEIDNDSNVGNNNDFDDNADNNSDNTAGDNSGNNSDNTAGDNSGNNSDNTAGDNSGNNSDNTADNNSESNNSNDTGGNSGDNNSSNVGDNSGDSNSNTAGDNSGNNSGNNGNNSHGHNYQIVITPAGYERRGYIEKVCSECGDTETLSEISAITSITLQNEVCTYTGKSIKPKVVIKDETGAVLGKDNYTTTYSNNKSIGIAKVSITFKGNYSGTIEQSFTIAPKSVSITSVSALSKGFAVSWKKGKDITGYEIQYSVNRKFTTKTSKKVLVTGKNTLKKQIKKITGNKNYYVRIRTYKTVKGKKIYSNWSSAKSVKTKK